MRPRFIICIVSLYSLLFSIGSRNAHAQSLDPDSLLAKVEEFGQYLLYKNHDTAYIKNLSDQFAFKLIGVNKFNFFRIKDGNLNSSARYRPDRGLNLGFGFSYKWFAIDLAFNVGISENSEFKNSKFLDFQGTIFSSRQFITASYQYYYGYQLHKIQGIETDIFPSSAIRDDIRTITFAMQYVFALNHDKFSLKASFIHNEIQKKNAGSLLLGAGFSMYNMSADSSAIPSEVGNNFNELLHLTDLSSTNFSLGFGYMYTFIIAKHFYITASLVPGLGINIGDNKTDFRRPYNTHLYLGLKSMNSVGYNSLKLFGGFQFSSDLFRTRIEKQLSIRTGHGKAKIFIGYRFG